MRPLEKGDEMTRLMNLNLASEMEVVEELRMTDMTKVSKKDVKKMKLSFTRNLLNEHLFPAMPDFQGE